MSLKLLVVFYLTTILTSQGQMICDNSATDFSSSNVVYQLRQGSEYCYRYFETPLTFEAASGVCLRDQATLIRIDSKEENDYINSTFSSQNGFWMGLSDRDTDGIFRWIDNDDDVADGSFQGWVNGEAAINNNEPYDCVKYTSQGWTVHQGFCGTSLLPFACRQLACNSTDGETCNGPVESSSSISPGVIAVIVVIPIIIVLIVGIAVFLLIMWKFQNDIFNKYICCCVYGSSKAQVNTLKQEIQRLQTELSQQKLNSSGRFSQLNSSGRFSQMTRQQSQVSVLQQQPIFNRSMSSNKVVPIGGPAQTPTAAAPRPSYARGNSTMSLLKSPLKAPLPPVNEEKKPVTTPLSQPSSPTDGEKN